MPVTQVAFLKRSEAVVRERITALPGFPQAIRLPVAGSKGRGQPLWKAKEMIAWAEKHQETASPNRACQPDR